MFLLQYRYASNNVQNTFDIFRSLNLTSHKTSSCCCPLLFNLVSALFSFLMSHSIKFADGILIAIQPIATLMSSAFVFTTWVNPTLHPKHIMYLLTLWVLVLKDFTHVSEVQNGQKKLLLLLGHSKHFTFELNPTPIKGEAPTGNKSHDDMWLKHLLSKSG